MSPELKNYYSTKHRKLAFYIVENDLNNEENPPELSALIGLDSHLKTDYFVSKRPTLEKPAMQTGIIVNRDINSTKKDKDSIVRRISKKNGMYCPNLPTQWRNNADVIIPVAEFGHFSATTM